MDKKTELAIDLGQTIYNNTIRDLQSKIDAQAKEIKALREICRDAYEVWAGSEGIPEPETASEGYLLMLVEQMRDIVKLGLIDESGNPTEPLTGEKQ